MQEIARLSEKIESLEEELKRGRPDEPGDLERASAPPRVPDG
jgi:hypothetical protein